MNYLLGVGPVVTGEFCDGIYKNMDAISEWMKRNSVSVKTAKPLAAAETASVPATASGSTRYLFALPKFKDGDAHEKDLLPPTGLKLTLTGATKPAQVILTRDGSELKHEYSGSTLTIQLPAAKRSQLVEVVQIDLASNLSQK